MMSTLSLVVLILLRAIRTVVATFAAKGFEEGVASSMEGQQRQPFVVGLLSTGIK